jgi:two-component system nitrogen regulation sensor histidine kinase GlnL
VTSDKKYGMMTQTIRQGKMHQDILESLDTAIAVLDEACFIRYMNPAAGAMLGVSTRRIKGVDLKHILPEVARQLSLHQAPQILTLHDIPLIRPDQKTLRLNCTLTPIEHPMLGWILEMLPRTKYERISQEEALWAQYEATTLLARTLAHEIKNPLAGISGSAQLLARQLSQPSQLEFVDLIIRETSRLSGLLDRMMGANQPAHWVTHNIHAVLEHVSGIVIGQCPANIHIFKDYDPSIPELTMDYDRLIQVFLNLMRNGVQAMHGEGKLTVRTRIKNKVTIGNKLHPLVVCVDVIDTGEGIPPELMDAIFLPMITNKPEGTGLGLPVAQSIVHQHGGMILVDSEPGYTRFRVYLPLEKDNHKVNEL